MRGRLLSGIRAASSILPVLLFALVFVLATRPAEAFPVPDGTALTGSESLPTQAQFFFPNFQQQQRVRPRPAPRPKRKRVYKKRQKVVTPRCAAPMTYSQGLRKCICAAEGHALSNGECRKLADLCTENGEWDAEANRCFCKDGDILQDGRCVDRSTAIAKAKSRPGAQCYWPRLADAKNEVCNCAPGYRENADTGACESLSAKARNGTTAAPRADGILTTEIALIQQCLKEAGYLRGAVAARMTKRAWTAYWYFKQDYKVGSTPTGVHHAKAQQSLFRLCPLAARAVYGTSYASLRDSADEEAKRAEEAAAEEEHELPPIRKVYAKPEAECLPDHLHRLIVSAYGKRSDLKRCETTCVAIPKGLSDREIRQFEARGVRWCRSCLELSSHLPLHDILRIERGANVQICTRPATRLPRWQRADGAPRVAYTKVRRLYRTLPTAEGHKNSVAVIIGNKNYESGLPANESAHNNAGAIYALLTEHLGYDQEHIIDLRDATLEDFTRVFGDAEKAGELPELLKKADGGNVLIYYAGHGTTRLDQSASYLLPVDTVEHREDRTAYPMSRLYERLGGLEADSVMLVLEADFGRDQSNFVYAPNLPELAVPNMPPKPIKGLTVLSAAERDQRSMDDPQYGIGLFTRYFIEGLAGRADLAPIGNNDLTIDAVELYAFTARMVDLAARKSYGMLQKPIMKGKAKKPVSSVQAQLQ